MKPARRRDPERVVAAVERIVTAGVGLTAVALIATAEAAELTLPQWRALVLVGRSPGSRIGELAATLGVSLPSASRLVRRMERSGLVAATRDETDRRATRVMLTDRGRTVQSAVTTTRRQALSAALGRLNPDLTDPAVASLEAIADAVAPAHERRRGALTATGRLERDRGGGDPRTRRPRTATRVTNRLTPRGARLVL